MFSESFDEFDFDVGSYESSFEFDEDTSVVEFEASQSETSQSEIFQSEASQSENADCSSEGSAANDSASANDSAPNYSVCADTKETSIQRIDSLFSKMQANKRVLTGIIKNLEEPKPADELQAIVDELQEFDYSVYTAANYSNLLERAGAITKCTEQGEVIGPNFKQAPEIVEIDGIEYYKPAQKPSVFLIATPCACEYIANDNHLEHFKEIVSSDKDGYFDVYKLVLEICNTEDGKSTKELEEIFRAKPELWENQIYPSHFTERLERCDALLWRGMWITTDIGREALKMQSEVF